jgi:hypothetical protein
MKETQGIDIDQPCTCVNGSFMVWSCALRRINTVLYQRFLLTKWQRLLAVIVWPTVYVSHTQLAKWNVYFQTTDSIDGIYLLKYTALKGVQIT